MRIAVQVPSLLRRYAIWAGAGGWNLNRAALLLAVHPFDSHLQTIEPFARGNEERLPVLTAKADVGSPRLRHINLLDLLARRGEDGHPFAREINVALAINRHSVRAHFAEQLLLCDRAVRLNPVAICLSRADVSHVKSLGIRGADDAVRLL